MKNSKKYLIYGSLLFSLPDNMVYMIKTNSICYARDKDKDDILNSFTYMCIYQP